MNLKCLMTICFALLCLVTYGCVSTPKIAVNTKGANLQKIKRISVVDFSDSPIAEAAKSGQVIANAIVSELMMVPDFTVLERQKLRTVLSEQKLSLSGLVDENNATKLGKLIGVDAIVVGAVSQYNTSSIPIYLVILTLDKDVYNVAASLRIIDVESGIIIFSGECSATSSESYQHAASKVAKTVVDKLIDLRNKK
jgi:curli biogenesis system outer membrane secretion channel CsgG